MQPAALPRPENFAPPEAERGERLVAASLTAADVLRAAEHDILEAKSDIDTARESIRESGEFPAFKPANETEELQAIEAEVDAAWEDLSKEVTEAEMPEDQETKLAELRERLETLAEAPECSIDDLEALCDDASRHAETKELVIGRLNDLIGKKCAESFFTDPEYRAQIRAIQEQLRTPIKEDGPMLSEQNDLKALVMFKEMFGTHIRDIAQALDLSTHESKLSYDPEKRPVFDIRMGVFNDDGEFDGVIGAGYRMRDEDGGESVIFRQFIRTVEKTAEGEDKTSLRVEHETFELADSLKSKGIAAKVTKASLEQYDAIGADEITLHADIDVGGYAWASYGYGWDSRVMSGQYFLKQRQETAVAELRAKNPTADKKEESRVRSEARKRASEEYARMSPQEHLQILGERVSEIAREGRNRALSAFREAGLVDANGASSDPKVRELLTAFSRAEENPLAVTPQHLAAIGKDGPILRKAVSGKWYSEDAFNAAVASGEEEGELPEQPGQFHAGKIGLLGSDWYGTVELKPDGAQGGKNRSLLEKKISRAS